MRDSESLLPRLPYRYEEVEEHVSIPIGAQIGVPDEYDIWEHKLNNKTIRRLQLESFGFLLLWVTCVFVCWLVWYYVDHV